MSRTSRNSEVTCENCNEGTAARTRPISLEEILSRRKKKLNVDDKGEAIASVEKADSGPGSDKGLESKKESKDAAKDNSRSLEEAVPKKEREYSESRNEGNGDSGANMNSKSYDSKSSRDKESKKEKENRAGFEREYEKKLAKVSTEDDKHKERDKESKKEKENHHKSRTSNHSGADFEKEYEKKLAKISIEKDKHGERDKESKKEKENHQRIRTSNHSGTDYENEYEKKPAKISMEKDKYEEIDKESKEERESHHRSRNSNHSGADFEKEYEKKPTKVSIEKAKHEERDKESKKEKENHHRSRTSNQSGAAVDKEYEKKPAKVSIEKYKPEESDKERKKEKENHHRSRPGNQLGADVEKDYEKKLAKISLEKDRHEERDSKSGKERKRKHDSHNDDKIRPENDDKERKRKHGGHNDDKLRPETDDFISKKRDFGKSRGAEYTVRKDQYTEHSERKDQKKEHLERKDQKKEHPRTHHEESRTKRRRSRSREYDQERDRSRSMSPRVLRSSHRGMDYDEPIFQSSKDKSRRKYSDNDKYRNSGNDGYGSGHYRKRGSGLGGYSPRKRRTGAAVRTPSPKKLSPKCSPKRSPEKKSSTWDQPPAGTSHGGSGSIFATLQSPSSKAVELTSSTPFTQTATKTQPVPSTDAASVLINASIDSVQLTQATRPRRRLYIENLPISASEKSVIDCLNDFVLSSGGSHIQGAKPCISCIINKEKHQAVVEFLTPEAATAAISFDGRSLSGSILKIRRPKDFVEAATGAPEKTLPTVKAISEVVKDSPHKIFIGGISNALSSDMFREVVSAFGLLRGYHFEFNEVLDGPCAFLEYEDHSITQKACAGLNGMKLGGHVLTAIQAFPDYHGSEEDAENLPSYDVPLHAKPLLADPTRVLQLKNVVNPEEFLSLSDSELEEIVEDIRLECARFGTVKSINVVKFNSRSKDDTQDSERREPLAATDQSRSPTKSCKNGDLDAAALDRAEGLQDASNINAENETNDDGNPEEDDIEKRNNDDEKPVEYKMKETVNLGSTDGDTSQLEVPSNLDKDINITEENTAKSEAHTSSEGIEQSPVGTAIPMDTTDLENSAADEDEVENGDDSNHQSHNVELLEPGYVLVEFLRKEAACAAAHCLHGRYYGEHIVSAGYFSHDLYITRFSR
ncbi:uncharacterized protein A4U43_C04F1570 [Asparagus officinalis]|uniref:RRM domain-containing protein n=1 Tax=Asparagus officinalis TaxID=4686 RepID=A0A5P1F260_ASPOF|nr:uncharacterized protein LOC109836399 [Asparagus officinalis]ONK70791.1 uncharacterized protein A4U43_C04F1570 [Asparagus officinalis]